MAGKKAKVDITQSPDWNWLSLKLRVSLLPHNPYFKQEVAEVRKGLRIPDGGYADLDSALSEWFLPHLQEHGSSFFPTDLTESLEYWVRFAYQHELAHFEQGYRAKRRGEVQPRLPILEYADELLSKFNLPRSVSKPLVEYLLTEEEIPASAVRTLIIQDGIARPHYPATDRPAAEEDPEEYLRGVYWGGLSENVPGELVVIKLIVNEYTTKAELEAAWEHVKQIKGQHRPVPNRRRSKVDEEWLKWFNARRVEGKTLITIANQFGKSEEAIRYALDQLDELMKPENSAS